MFGPTDNEIAALLNDKTGKACTSQTSCLILPKCCKLLSTLSPTVTKCALHVSAQTIEAEVRRWVMLGGLLRQQRSIHLRMSFPNVLRSRLTLRMDFKVDVDRFILDFYFCTSPTGCTMLHACLKPSHREPTLTAIDDYATRPPFHRICPSQDC
jgi:hypothetical protein